MGHFIPPRKQNKNDEDLITIFVRKILGLHSIPADIISDQDSRLGSKLWKCLIETLGI
jgi:hypothetical protein